MKCLSLFIVLITLVSAFAADVNVYKKNFDSTGKAYFFTPNENYKGKKIAVGEDCTKVVVTMQDASGNFIPPNETQKLSTHQGIYAAEIIRYPGGKCALPDTQKYGKEIITATPQELVEFFNGKQGPLKYEFKTENKSSKGGVGNLLSSKWLLIGVGSAALALIGAIVFFVARSRGGEDDYSKRLSSNDTDMRKISEPYIGLNNDNNNKDAYSIGQPFNTNISNPISSNYNSNNWNSPSSSPLLTANSKSGSTTNLLAAPEEPKRVTSITFEEQQSYSNLMKKHLEENRNPKGNDASDYNGGMSNIPEEYEKFKTFKVVRKFTPQRNDELVVEYGHMVKMLKSFEDGWTLCYNINTRQEGYIPKNKLASADQPQKPQNVYQTDTMGSNNSYSSSKPQKPQTIFHSDTTSTTSSAYSTKPLLHSNSGASSNYSYGNNNSYGRNRGQRSVNTRNNSASSRGNGGSLRGSPNSQPNKYYKRPSNDNYVNNNGYRSQNRYDM